MQLYAVTEFAHRYLFCRRSSLMRRSSLSYCRKAGSNSSSFSNKLVKTEAVLVWWLYVGIACSWQSAEKERMVVLLQQQLDETSSDRTQLRGKCTTDSHYPKAKVLYWFYSRRLCLVSIVFKIASIAWRVFLGCFMDVQVPCLSWRRWKPCIVRRPSKKAFWNRSLKRACRPLSRYVY